MVEIHVWNDSEYTDKQQFYTNKIPYELLFQLSYTALFDSVRFSRRFNNMFSDTEWNLARKFIHSTYSETESNEQWHSLAKKLHELTSANKDNCFEIIRTFSIVQSSVCRLYLWRNDNSTEQIVSKAPFHLNTPDTCIKFDNAIINIEDAIIGDNIAPHTYGCKCTTVKYFKPVPNRIIKTTDPFSNQNIELPGNLDHQKWLEFWEKKYGKEFIKMQKLLLQNNIFSYSKIDFLIFYHTLNDEIQKTYNLFTGFQLFQVAHIKKETSEQIKILTIAAIQPSTSWIRSEIFRDLGDIYMSNGNNTLAIENFTKSIQLNPKIGRKRILNKLLKEVCNGEK